MFKLTDKKIITIYAESFCLTDPMILNSKKLLIWTYTHDSGTYCISRFIQASLCKIQGLLKDFPTVLRTENL